MYINSVFYINYNIIINKSGTVNLVVEHIITTPTCSAIFAVSMYESVYINSVFTLGSISLKCAATMQTCLLSLHT